MNWAALFVFIRISYGGQYIQPKPIKILITYEQ
jgi:hypothetical protein